ncbi:Oidioi.mRNA.OKI2018_I69.PAR.g11470.t1.cds [Oikopleura dioica]|uniref:Oidioi.mRNA.OKI2018_I69.PAR.g11470.t1.cds n=1 Tax=Oikopleura dioica TaxID=34765 RepID=A0ABN7RW69_OIKDI|nr:Oidioi.mRNA.OKI2018_I69.PAR.g11470.t1.cds [Oikopleura dioica]
MQSSMKCCGWTSFREYENGYPSSCCSAYALDPENIRQISSWTCKKPFTIACEEAAFGVLKWIILTTIIEMVRNSTCFLLYLEKESNHDFCHNC